MFLSRNGRLPKDVAPYIILLVIAILVTSYYSSTAVKVFGRNNIAILATLFLLSYS